MRRTFLLVTLGLAVTAVCAGQMKLSGKMDCGKADPQMAVPVADAPGHALMVAHDKCNWSEGEIGGAKMETSEDTISSEARGNVVSDRGYSVVSVAGGDKAFVKFEGKTNMKDQKPSDGKGTWTFIGGTGKLKGLKGKGTYEGTFNADGVPTWTIEGEYSLAATAARAEPKAKS